MNIRRIQALDSDETGKVLALLRDVERATQHPAMSEAMLLELSGASGAHGAGQFVAAFLADDPEGTLAGYAQLTGGPASWTVELVVQPRLAGNDGEENLHKTLIGEALGEVSASGGGTVHLILQKPSVATEAAALAVGLQLDRRLLQMRRSLPLDPPYDRSRVPTRAFVIGADELEWLTVNNRAFAGHPEQGAWDLAMLAAREELDWFDPAGFLLHEQGGRLAAFCWTKVHPPSTPGVGGAGEIYVIGVDPDFQGRGLGKALTVAGAAYLAARGIPEITLYVDADNEVGVALYRSLGFLLDHEDHAYLTAIDPRLANRDGRR